MSTHDYSIAELAERFGLTASGDGSRAIDGVGTLAGAGPSQLSFLSNSKYTAQLAATRAGVVVLREENLADCPTAALVAADPYVAYAKIAALFERLPAAPAGIHPSAVVAASARVSSQRQHRPGLRDRRPRRDRRRCRARSALHHRRGLHGRRTVAAGGAGHPGDAGHAWGSACWYTRAQ